VVALKVPEVPVMVTVELPAVAVALAVSVSTLLPVVGLVPNAAVTPLGKPDAARVTLPAKGLTSVTVIVSVPLLPWVMVSEAAERESVKLPVPAALTVSAMVVVAVTLPEVPVIVTVADPVVAVLLAVNVSTLLPVAGLVPNVAVTPLGNPEAARVTLPVNPPTSVTVIVSVALLLRVTARVDADGASVKPDVGFTVSAMVVVAVTLPEVPVIVTVAAPVVAVLLAVRVSTLLPVVGLVPNVAVTPLGNPDAARVTLPVNPPTSVTVIVSVALLPRVTARVDAERESVKLEAVVTESAMLVVAVAEPDVPVIVTVDPPIDAVLLAVNVSTLVPVVGLVPNAAVTPLGRPDAARVTLPVNPLKSVTVMVSVAVLPCTTDRLVDDGASVKPDPGTVRTIVAECVIVPLVPVIDTLYVPAGVLVCELKFTTLVPLLFSEEGAKLALTPLGRPLALRDTLPVRPPTKARVIVLVGFVPGGSEIAAGETEIVKLGSAVTVRASVAVSTVEPLVPVTVTVSVPTVAVFDAVKVSVLPADPVTEAGLKAAVTPEGKPLTVSATALSKPFIAETVMLLAADVPCSTVAPDAVTLKPGEVEAGIGGNAFCTSSTNSVIQKVPAEGEFGIAPVAIPLASVLSCAGSQFGSPFVEVTPLYTLPG
jgi:hypothetical protein